jgi:hypothetical protein
MQVEPNINFLNTNNYSLFHTSATKFKNEDYILKLNNSPHLKFFKDELTIKYIGKGYNTIDYAVNQ